MPRVTVPVAAVQYPAPTSVVDGLGLVTVISQLGFAAYFPAMHHLHRHALVCRIAKADIRVLTQNSREDYGYSATGHRLAEICRYVTQQQSLARCLF